MLYKITSKTCAIIPNKDKSEVIEDKDILTFKDSSLAIIEHNCYLYGSSLEGRKKGSAYLIGTNYKPPIILNEQEDLILLPTHSTRNLNCCWIVLNKILNYYSTTEDYTTIEFQNNTQITIPISSAAFDKQVLRATRLESILRGRNNQKYL